VEVNWTCTRLEAIWTCDACKKVQYRHWWTGKLPLCWSSRPGETVCDKCYCFLKPLLKVLDERYGKTK